VRSERKRENERLHKQATKICADSDCLACAKTGCVPAHFPRHRGMGGGHAGWVRGEWVPLCPRCHDILDGRMGVSAQFEAQRQETRAIVAREAPLFWERIRQEYGL
jgi:hypothetical protein